MFKIILMISSIVFLSSNLAQAAEQSDPFIAKLRASEDEGWVLLSDDTIAKMKTIANQSEYYTCGPNCAARVGKACDKNEMTHETACSDCPLSLKITAEFIKPFVEMFNAPFPLIIGPTPQMLCNYMNTNNFSKDEMKPVCIAEEAINMDLLIDNMMTSISSNLPGIVHVSSDGIKTHYMTVVGISIENIALLDTDGTISTISINALKLKMNTALTTNLVKYLESLRDSISKFAEKLPTVDEVANFKPFSYICFQ